MDEKFKFVSEIKADLAEMRKLLSKVEDRLAHLERGTTPPVKVSHLVEVPLVVRVDQVPSGVASTLQTCGFAARIEAKGGGVIALQAVDTIGNESYYDLVFRDVYEQDPVAAWKGVVSACAHYAEEKALGLNRP